MNIGNLSHFTPVAGLPNFPELLDMDKSTIPCVHGGALKGVLHFLYYPTRGQLVRYTNIANSRNRPPDAPSEPVFVGQVPHLLPVEIVGWVIDTVLKRYACPWMARGSKTGCVKAWVTNRGDLEQLLEFSRCVMFDLNGIWYASPTDRDLRMIQLISLDEYCTRIKGGQERTDPRLPKGSIVFELLGQPKLRDQPPLGPSALLRPAMVGARNQAEGNVEKTDDDYTADEHPGHVGDRTLTGSQASLFSQVACGGRDSKVEDLSSKVEDPYAGNRFSIPLAGSKNPYIDSASPLAGSKNPYIDSAREGEGSRCVPVRVFGCFQTLLDGYADAERTTNFASKKFHPFGENPFREAIEAFPPSIKGSERW